MKRILVVFFFLGGGVAVGSQLRAQPSDDGLGDVEHSFDAVAAPDPAVAAYEARIASHGQEAAVVDVELPPLCPAGSLLWHRDVATDLCTPVCTTDADCLEGLERCAVVSLPDAAQQVRVFADDDDAALDRIEAEQAIGLCDVFFDVDGPPSADLIAVAPDDLEER